jgi:Ca2+-binding RTX toxin-like protein
LVGSKGRDRLRGGAGRDQLRARDGERDIVSGGPGKDRAAVDAIDVVRKLEKASGKKASKGKGRPRLPGALREIMAHRSTH